MLRQRVRLRSSPAEILGRALLLLLALAFVWYGLMAILLGLGVSRGTVNDISGYRSAYDFLTGLTPSDITGPVRLGTGLAGITAFLLFGYLAARNLPRPYLARSGLDLQRDERGMVTVEPRAVERAAEVAARSHPAVLGSSGRLEDGSVVVRVRLRRSDDIAGTLRAVRERVAESLGQHGLPALPVEVTMTAYETQTKRELH